MKTTILLFTFLASLTIYAQPEIAKNTSLDLTKSQKVEFKMVPVDDNTKYTLVFNGQMDGVESIEENPRMQIALQNRRNSNDNTYDFLPKMQMQFFDSTNKLIAVKNHCALPFRDKHKYIVTFYPPYGGVSMKLIIQAGSNTSSLKITDMQFDKAENQGAININPIVDETGLYDYCAWDTFASGAGLIEKEDGKIGFNSAYGSNSARFPLEPKTEYIATGSGDNLGYASTIVLRVLDENNKKIQEVKIYGKVPGVKFTTPTNCVSGIIHVRSVVLDQAKVNKTK